MSSRRRPFSPGPTWRTVHDERNSDCDDTETEVDELRSPSPERNPLKRPKVSSNPYKSLSHPQSALSFVAKKRLRVDDPEAVKPPSGQKHTPTFEGNRRIASKSVPTCSTGHLRISISDRERLHRSQQKKAASFSSRPNDRLRSLSSSFSPPPLDEVFSSSHIAARKESLGSGSRSAGASFKKTPTKGHASRNRTTKQSSTKSLGCVELFSSSEDERPPRSTPRKKKTTAPRDVIEILSSSEDEKSAPKSFSPIDKQSQTQPSCELFLPSPSPPAQDDARGSGNIYTHMHAGATHVAASSPTSDFDMESFESPSSSSRKSTGSSGSSSTYEPQTPKIFERSCAFFKHKFVPREQQYAAASDSSTTLYSSGATSSSPVTPVSPNRVENFLKSSQFTMPNTNSLPERLTYPCDKHVISQFPLNREMEVKDRDREIAKYRAAITLLENRKNGAPESMANLRSFLAPIHTLPTEVLTPIFIEAIHGTDETHVSRRRRRRRRIPFVLSTVCQRWRDIALCFPGLWTQLRVLKGDWETDGIKDILDCYVTRSQKCPLTVELNLPITLGGLPFMDHRVDDYLRPVLEALIQHSTRWEHLKITGRTALLLYHPVFYKIKGRLPVLHHLEILQHYGNGGVIYTESNYDLFSDCPQLRTVDTEWPPYIVDDAALLQQLQFPWSQIRSWMIDVEEWKELRSRPCDSLVHLEIDDYKEEESPDMSESEETLTSNLTSLKLVGPGVRTGTTQLCSVLDSTLFPRLSSLELENLSQSWFTPLLGCLTRSSSSCTITRLTLEIVSITSETITNGQIVSLLRNTSSVRALSLKHELPLSRGLLKKFALSHANFPAPTPILPLLEEFSLVLNNTPQMDDNTIMDVLATRWLPDPDYAKSVRATCLRSVTVKFPANPLRAKSKKFFQPDMASLHDLRAAGMRIDVVVLD
ncbi:hypothetical protein V5O48_012219 [Marasmius crinis-equi]|uniref:F-box domain-containing protein n=1 Tax=Marasmius crinis-equi TaxID=585013 RepID=A0ABR3F3F6_9AGAR